MKNSNQLLESILKKKITLDGFRPFPMILQKNIEDWLRIELTYNSNAIEGNTLSRAETLLVVEKGITAQGKTLVEHQEAINHAEAFNYIAGLIAHDVNIPLKEIVFAIHSIILNRINDQYKGRYRDVPVRIQASNAVLPNPLKVQEKMEEFFRNARKRRNLSVPDQAIAAHYEFVRIHPFIDGNGRTARLLMNYILLKNGFAPALILKEERAKYIGALEEYHVSDRQEKYYSYMYKTILRGLDSYLKLLVEPSGTTVSKLMKIGELATVSRVSIATIRHWTKEGLLDVQDHSQGGYQLYSHEMIDRIGQIRTLQHDGLSLGAIKKKIL